MGSFLLPSQREGSLLPVGNRGPEKGKPPWAKGPEGLSRGLGSAAQPAALTHYPLTPAGGASDAQRSDAQSGSDADLKRDRAEEGEGARIWSFWEWPVGLNGEVVAK